MHICTLGGKLGELCLLQLFDPSLRFRDMMEDDLSIFRVRIGTRHGKLGGVHLLQFFDMSLRFKVTTDSSLTHFRQVSGFCSYNLAWISIWFKFLGCTP